MLIIELYFAHVFILNLQSMFLFLTYRVPYVFILNLQSTYMIRIMQLKLWLNI